MGHTVIQNGGGKVEARHIMVRFAKVVDGIEDFGGIAQRAMALIDAINRNPKAEQKGALGPDFLRWGKRPNRRKHGEVGGNGVMISHPMRIVKIEQLEAGDMWFGNVDGAISRGIMIRSSKTDQQAHGLKGTLTATNCAMRSVQTEDFRSGRKDWRPHSGKPLWSTAIGKVSNGLRRK